ncbi:MAG: hypothetical protein AAF487_05365, partial [Bacteroidota bacterium]
DRATTYTYSWYRALPIHTAKVVEVKGFAQSTTPALSSSKFFKVFDGSPQERIVYDSTLEISLLIKEKFELVDIKKTYKD